eukprot:358767-Chlamydomonas_euryale.AAC.6
MLGGLPSLLYIPQSPSCLDLPHVHASTHAHVYTCTSFTCSVFRYSAASFTVSFCHHLRACDALSMPDPACALPGCAYGRMDRPLPAPPT